MVRRKTKPKTELTPESTKLLIEVLARTIVLFWPSREPFDQRRAQVRHQRQRVYIQGGGIDISGGGSAADRQKFGRLLGDLESRGLVTIGRSTGRRQGVRLTTLGDTVARRRAGWRTQAEVWHILERAGDLDRRSVRRSLPEHLFAGIQEWNSEEDSHKLTDFWLDAVSFLTAGYLTAFPDTDSPPKYWIGLTEAGRVAIAAGKPSDAPPEIEFDQEAGDLCDALEKQATAELETAKPNNEPGEIIIRIPCGIGWGGCYSDWFLPGQAPEGAVSFAESFAAAKARANK